ncbi:MAG: glycosyltransferase [Hyphomonadaceae bacterium]|nr:glycosyltransferase [Hyphomonadaceae bacterium]
MTAEPSTATAVIIAAYQAEATIEQAIRSALDQPETAEVYVIDDASQDRTFALAQAIAATDSRVTVARHDANQGPAIARNAAINATTSPWITVLDADDYMLPGRLARLHAFGADADLVADMLTRRTIEERSCPTWSPAPLTARQLTFTEFVIGDSVEITGVLHTGFLKPLMRRSFLNAHGIRYKPLRLGEDYDLYARALLHGARFLTCGEAGYVSIERPGSLSKAHSEEDLRLHRDCDDELAHIRPLSREESRALRSHRLSVDCRYQWRRLITAVKTRDLAAALATFHSPGVAGHLLGKLAEQAWLRSTGRGPQRQATAAGERLFA